MSDTEPIYQDTPIGRLKSPKHQTERVQAMSDEELEENTRTEDGRFIDPHVIAEKERRRKKRLGLPYP